MPKQTNLLVRKSLVEFFDGLGEDQEVIKKEILGPSWRPKKNNLQIDLSEESSIKDKELPINGKEILQVNYEKGTQKKELAWKRILQLENFVF